jgi:uncharacterized alpha-E superfamily protein
MLSRLAECLYWLGRYVERAESTARLVSVNGNLVRDLPRGIVPEWEPLITITGGAPLFEEHHDEYSERSVVRFLISERRNPGSILSSLQQARENTRTLRAVLPREAWELVNEMYLNARDELSSGLSKRGRFDYLRGVIRGSQALVGVLDGGMNHDAGRLFLELGRTLERADMTTRIVDVRSATLLPEGLELRPFDNIQWMSVLRSLSAYQMYRLRMQVRVRRADALGFLLQDEVFPRSVYHCLSRIDGDLAELPRHDQAREITGALQRKVQRARVRRLSEHGDELHGFLDRLQIELGELHDAVATTWFLT